MTPYELTRTLALPVLPALHGRVHRDLRRLTVSGASILDIGGRSSPYTAGLRGVDITLLDIPRQSEVQEDLHLGVNPDLLARLRRRRSNIAAVRIEDMCETSLDAATFDGAVAVEVLEHVPDDESFLAQTARVLRPGGWAYFTTPNGDWVKNEPPHYNPDHLRHYLRHQLEELLARHFDEVEVVYAIKTGRHRMRGLRSFDLRQPIELAGTLISNLRSHFESRGLDQTSRRTAHLVAIVRKAADGSTNLSSDRA